MPEFYVIRCFDVYCTVPSLSEILLTFTVGRFHNKFDRIQFRSLIGQLKDGRTDVRLLWTVYKEQNTMKLKINIPCSLSANMTVASEDSSVPLWAIAVRVLPWIILLLFQANNAYTRDQWFHSIIWKVRTYRSYFTIYRSCSTAAAI